MQLCSVGLLVVFVYIVQFCSVGLFELLSCNSVRLVCLSCMYSAIMFSWSVSCILLQFQLVCLFFGFTVQLCPVGLLVVLVYTVQFCSVGLFVLLFYSAIMSGWSAAGCLIVYSAILFGCSV